MGNATSAELTLKNVRGHINPLQQLVNTENLIFKKLYSCILN
jgi:hypothetical protein